jgi:hypothetical protein
MLSTLKQSPIQRRIFKGQTWGDRGSTRSSSGVFPNRAVWSFDQKERKKFIVEKGKKLVRLSIVGRQMSVSRIPSLRSDVLGHFLLPRKEKGEWYLNDNTMRFSPRTDEESDVLEISCSQLRKQECPIRFQNKTRSDKIRTRHFPKP